MIIHGVFIPSIVEVMEIEIRVKLSDEDAAIKIMETQGLKLKDAWESLADGYVILKFTNN